MSKYPPSLRNKEPQESPQAVYGIAPVFSNRWLIAGVFFAVAALGLVHALTAAPLYEASMVLQLNRAASLPGDTRVDMLVSTEMELLRSRSILSAVAEKLRLDVSVEPKSDSLFDEIRGRLFDDAAARERAFNDGQLRISGMRVPNPLLKHPFVLTAQGGNKFTVTSSMLPAPIEGMAGMLAHGHSTYGDVDIFVSDMRSRPGTQFTLRRISLLQATEQLQRSLVVAESGKQSNVIRVTLQGARPELLSRILNEIGNEYMRQRFADVSRQNASVVGIFDRQLDESRQALRNVDERYAALIRHYGIATPGEDGRTVAAQSVALRSKLEDTGQKKLELSSRFGEHHPAMEAVDRQIARLTIDLQRNEAKYRSLAAAERELARVSQEQSIIREINTGLINQKNKLDTLMPSKNMEARLVDRSEPPVQPLTMGFSTMVVLSCFAGLFLGIVASIIKNSLSRRSRARLISHREARFRLITVSRADASRSS